MLLYHHCRSLDSVVYGEVEANPKYSDEHFKNAYSWLEKEVGFYPLFLAVGITKKDIQMTGYENQWNRVIGSKIVGRRKDGAYIQRNILRKKGRAPNDVLFSFENVSKNSVFMDYLDWYLVLNSSHKNYQITDYEKRLIFKPSWNKAKWLRKAMIKPYSVQLVTPSLNLSNAKRIWVRNKQTKEELISKGFKNVECKRIFLESGRV